MLDIKTINIILDLIVVILAALAVNNIFGALLLKWAKSISNEDSLFFKPKLKVVFIVIWPVTLYIIINYYYAKFCYWIVK